MAQNVMASSLLKKYPENTSKKVHLMVVASAFKTPSKRDKKSSFKSRKKSAAIKAQR